MTWQAELTHDEDVERRAESAGDFEGDGHASARQRDDHNMRLALTRFQRCG